MCYGFNNFSNYFNKNTLYYNIFQFFCFYIIRKFIIIQFSNSDRESDHYYSQMHAHSLLLFKKIMPLKINNYGQ
jgi:hypothetical protein